jgi:Ca2+/Na+ antiporter
MIRKIIFLLLTLIPAAFAESIDTFVYSFIILILLLIAAGVAYVIYVYYSQQKQQNEKKEKIKKYIHQLLKQGQNPLTIKQKLIEYGWNEELITQTIRELHTTFKNTPPKTPRYGYTNKPNHA